MGRFTLIIYIFNFSLLRIILNSKKHYEKLRYTAKEKALHYITLDAPLPFSERGPAFSVCSGPTNGAANPAAGHEQKPLCWRSREGQHGCKSMQLHTSPSAGEKQPRRPGGGGGQGDLGPDLQARRAVRPRWLHG